MNELYNHYKLITSKFYKIPQPEKWSDDYKVKFQKICGPLMKKLGFEN
jgi:hypothetical protein